MLKKRSIILIFIIAFSLVLRLLWLDKIPIAISNDELDYVLDAKSVFYSGRDLAGNWSPFSLTTPSFQVPKAELPALLVAPFIGPARLSLFSARLPYVFWGIVLIAVLYLIGRELFNEKIAVIVALVAAVNPWSFYFSRTSFDIPLAGVFYFISLFLLIRLKGWKLLFSFPFLFMAFFSYIGTKLIFLPFVLIISFYSWFFVNKKKHSRWYFLLFFLCLCVFGWFVISLKNQPVGSRTDELLTPFHSVIAQRVDEERRLSIDNPLMILFSNKAVVFGKLFFEKYMGIWSTNFLFLFGEGRATYSMWTHGMFYYLDAVFVILGFCYLFIEKRQAWLLLVALTAIAPLPAAISTVGEEYALRGVLLFPILIIFIGLGIYYFLTYFKKTKYRLPVTLFIVAVYGFLLLNLLNIYFFRNPIYNSEGFGFSQRAWVNYANLSKYETGRVLIVTDDAFGAFKKYIFYSNIVNRKTMPLVRKMIAENEYFWENISFLQGCLQELTIPDNETVILLSDLTCLDNEAYPDWLSIARLGDGGEVLRIVNDRLCFRYHLGRYPAGIRLADLGVEKMTPAKFCEKYITDLTGYSEAKSSLGN